MTWRWTTTSRALVGSSAMITFGCSQIAMAMHTRCFMPPLSSCGYSAQHARRQADRRQQARRVRAASALSDLSVLMGAHAVEDLVADPHRPG